MKLDITTNHNSDEETTLKLSSEVFEINIHFTPYDIDNLKKWAATFAGNQDKSIQSGICANNKVFWNHLRNEKQAYILVGHDDQTWDFSITITTEDLKRIMTSI